MEVIPPHMVNEASAFATGQLPDKEGQMYVTKEEGLPDTYSRSAGDEYCARWNFGNPACKIYRLLSLL